MQTRHLPHIAWATLLRRGWREDCHSVFEVLHGLRAVTVEIKHQPHVVVRKKLHLTVARERGRRCVIQHGLGSAHPGEHLVEHGERLAVESCVGEHFSARGFQTRKAGLREKLPHAVFTISGIVRVVLGKLMRRLFVLSREVIRDAEPPMRSIQQGINRDHLPKGGDCLRILLKEEVEIANSRQDGGVFRVLRERRNGRWKLLCKLLEHLLLVGVDRGSGHQCTEYREEGISHVADLGRALRELLLKTAHAGQLARPAIHHHILAMFPPVRLLVGLLLPASLWAAEPVDFNRDIRPILADHCFKCHGFDPGTREAGRRLDTREGALADSEGLRAIVPGKLKDSDVHWRINSKDADEVMPPAKGGKPLNAQQIALLDKWIEQGAEYAEHWAFKNPQRHTPPAAGNPIDAFIGKRLQAEGLQFAPEAERHTLIRRLSLDLIGLPPTPAEVDAFTADAAPDAYQRLVDRLLASPHYGEKWGRHWLDSARYADTNGYEKDSPRSIWLYREWVIGALNSDIPYDSFLIEQLAGDLLPGANSAQHVATGFLRNSMLNEEGGVDPEQFRVEQVVDRVETVGRSILGLTVQCAQCHDHKYDPISQKDYFQLFAFLNNDEEAIYYHPSAKDDELRAEIKGRVRGIEDELRKADADLGAKQAAWEKQMLEAPRAEWVVLDPVETFGDTGVKFEELADHSLVARGDRQAEGQYSVTVHTPLEKITGFRVELITDPTLPHSGPGRREDNGNCVLTDFSVEVAPASAPKDAPMEKIALGTPTADYEQKDFTVTQAIDGDPKKSGWAVGTAPGQNRSAHAVFPVVTPVGSAEGRRLSFRLTQKFGEQHCIGRFRLLATITPNPTADPLPSDLRQILAIAPDQRSADQKQRVFTHYRTTRADWAEANGRIAAELQRWPVGTNTLALADRPGGRETHLFKRGDWMQPGQKIQPGGLAILPPAPESNEPPRLRFARWLASPEQPTVARVFVNRVWQQYFGTGLFATAEDVGFQGELPSHPELLDWLAWEFVDRGWSQKALHRMIVTSATYRQSSTVSPSLAEKDPYNRLLARGPRFRVGAEEVRDLALSVSGLLNPKIGGPSVFPVIPNGALSIAFGNTDWNVSAGSERHRRAMYIHWKRSAPFPSLAVFDAPTAEKACNRRGRSNTPLQALTTLNDPAFMECAQSLALRIYQEAGPDDRTRLIHGFRLCTGRSPDNRETDALLALLAQERQTLEEDTARAITIALADPAKLPPGVNLHKVAAWTLVSRVLLNLDETLTKE